MLQLLIKCKVIHRDGQTERAAIPLCTTWSCVVISPKHTFTLPVGCLSYFTHRLPDHQSAYRAFRSTETAIAGLLPNILLALDAGDIIIITIRQFVRRHNMSVKSLQGRRVTAPVASARDLGDIAALALLYLSAVFKSNHIFFTFITFWQP